LFSVTHFFLLFESAWGTDQRRHAAKQLSVYFFNQVTHTKYISVKLVKSGLLTHRLSSHEIATISNSNHHAENSHFSHCFNYSLVLVNNSVSRHREMGEWKNIQLHPRIEYNLEAAQNINGIKITSFQVGLFAINIIDDLFFHCSIKSCWI
jgi:hypothetical protein